MTRALLDTNDSNTGRPHVIAFSAAKFLLILESHKYEDCDFHFKGRREYTARSNKFFKCYCGGQKGLLMPLVSDNAITVTQSFSVDCCDRTNSLLVASGR